MSLAQGAGTVETMTMPDEQPKLDEGIGLTRQRRDGVVNCCRRPRISVQKRWVENGKLQVIERCRRCQTWRRREVAMKWRDGRIDTEMTLTQYQKHVTDDRNAT